MIRMGHIPARGWRWWWLDERTVLVHTGRHDLLLIDRDGLPALLGPGYANRERGATR